MKQLRFVHHPQPDESVIGALAAGCRDHRLVRIASALEGGEIGIVKPGLVQLADADEAARLAYVLRTDVDLIAAIAFGTTNSRGSLTLGELRMPRPAFDFVHRRIGPKSLAVRPHHRSAWLNRLLPFCPESLEHLVEECPGCGPLGWRKTRGIATCEFCGREVPPSDQPPLGSDLEADYRLAADLMARDPSVGRRAAAQLPACLQPYSRTALVDVMLKSGVMASDVPTRWELDQLRTQPSATVAQVVSAGARLLREWPTGIQMVVARRMETNVDDLCAYDGVRNDVRWISKYSGKEGEAILGMAFPRLDGRTVRTFSSTTRFYTATEVNQRLWSSSVELGRLRDAQAIRFEPLPSRQRLRARYDADDVDELRRQLRAGETPVTTAARFDLPTYAVGQLVTLNRLIMLNHPGVLVLHGSLIDIDSARKLDDDLRRNASTSEAPAGAVSVRYAMTRYGGEKPWGKILGQMLDGRITYHLRRSEIPEVRNIMVDPGQLPAAETGETDTANPLSLTHVSLRDAHEILGAGHYEAEATIAAANLTIVPFGKGKGVSRRELIRLAAQVAFSGEAAARSPLSPQAMHRELTRQGVKRMHEAWSREELARRGLVDRPVGDLRVSEAV